MVSSIFHFHGVITALGSPSGQCSSSLGLQAMYGIIHGGSNHNLRRMSSEFVTSLPFDGYAMGGTLGKDRCVSLLTTPPGVPAASGMKCQDYGVFGSPKSWVTAVLVCSCVFTVSVTGCIIKARFAMVSVAGRTGRFDYLGHPPRP